MYLCLAEDIDESVAHRSVELCLDCRLFSDDETSRELSSFPLGAMMRHTCSDEDILLFFISILCCARAYLLHRSITVYCCLGAESLGSGHSPCGIIWNMLPGASPAFGRTARSAIPGVLASQRQKLLGGRCRSRCMLSGNQACAIESSTLFHAKECGRIVPEAACRVIIH